MDLSGHIKWTSIDSIVQTYQSLSRGNFAMLDNLKLGYGGTKAELERLIADASTYTDIQKEMGITVDASSMSFDNIVNAIAVVQGKLGIAGATAQEAGTTIEGSVNSMKSAWQNLITGIADDNADLGKLIDNFVVTIVGDGTETNLGVLGNIMPAVETALGGATKLIEGIFPKIAEELPKWVGDVLPSLANSAVLIVESLVNSISDNSDMLATNAIDVVFTLANGILNLLPKIVKLGLDLIISLANGITQAIQEDDFIQTIIDVVGQIVETLTDPTTLANLINSALDLILALVEGLLSDESLTALVDAVVLIIENLVDYLLDPENINKIVDVGVSLLVAMTNGLWNARWRIIQAVFDLCLEIMQEVDNVDWVQVGKDIINRLWDGIVEIWNNLVSWFQSETGWFSDIFGGFADVYKNRFTGNTAYFNGSHAGGLSYVPFDGYIAQLHKGERVLTASEAQRYNNGQYYGGTTDVNVTVGFDNDDNGMGLARWLYPKIKQVEKEVYA